MKTFNALLILSTLTTHAVANPQSDDPDYLLYHLGVTIEKGRTNGLEPADCQPYLARLRELGVPATRTVEIAFKNPFLASGNHPLPVVSKACNAMEYAGKLEIVTRSIRHALTLGSTRGCSELWPDAIAAGVNPNEPIADGVIGAGITGTLESLKRKYCDEPLAATEAKVESELAPYRKVLSNDKLAIFLDYRREHGIVLRGGDTHEVPARLATSNTWYTWRLGKDCSDGRTKYVVRRYDFDAKQRLKKESVAEYCGEAVYK